MQKNWQIKLKQKLRDNYEQTSQEWIELNISTSGLLNLTILRIS